MSPLDEDEGPVSRAGSDPEDGQPASTLGFALGSRQNREGEGEGPFPDPEGVVGDQHVLEAAGQVPQGYEGRPGSRADFDGAPPASFGNRVATAIPQQLTNRDDWGFRRSPFPQSRDREVSTVWLDAEPGPRGRGVRVHGWVGLQFSPGVSFHFRGPDGGCTPEQEVRYRSKGSVGRQRALEEGLDSVPWSDSKSGDELSEMPPMRVSVRQKGGGWAKPKRPNDTCSPWRSPVREKFLPVPGPCVSVAPRTLPLGKAGQAVRDPEVSSRKPHSVTRGEAGSKPSYLPLVAAAGGLPKATPRWKVAQVRRSLEEASKVVRQSFFRVPGQRGSGPPQDPATFSRISGVPPFGRGASHALTPFGTKESKPTGAGQESVAQRSSGSEPVVGEGDDKEPTREPFPESESLTHGQSTSIPCGDGGGCEAGAVISRRTQDPPHSEPLALSEEDVLASGPALSSDPEPPEELPRPERLQQQAQHQQPPGAESCPQCEEPQRGMHALRQQVVAMQSLADKLEKLGSGT